MNVRVSSVGSTTTLPNEAPKRTQEAVHGAAAAGNAPGQHAANSPISFPDRPSLFGSAVARGGFFWPPTAVAAETTAS